MKMKEAKYLLKQGEKIATKEMMKNGDFLFLDGNTVRRTWNGNEQFFGDKYFQLEAITDWQIKGEQQWRK